ncbi:hypothetical protein ABZ923_31180 [Streptomyces sp. NPDC046881]|uniref:hypothetical protein n=1 Tax=Streptomyces sp. NPDC046881 TaxID=3155374 RepID=UPI0033C895A3
MGIAPTIMVAATACAQITGPGGVLVLAPEQVADWLDTLLVEALHGIGPRQAAVRRDYGIRWWGRQEVAQDEFRRWVGDYQSMPGARLSLTDEESGDVLATCPDER